jgi:hypothetical protein
MINRWHTIIVLTAWMTASVRYAGAQTGVTVEGSKTVEVNAAMEETAMGMEEVAVSMVCKMNFNAEIGYDQSLIFFIENFSSGISQAVYKELENFGFVFTNYFYVNHSITDLLKNNGFRLEKKNALK